jgi:hypothetical protein
MGKRVLIMAVVICVVAAACAWGQVGSVISSFAWPGTNNVYRNGNYVFGVSGTNTLQVYNVNGSMVRTGSLTGLVSPGDADHSVKGTGHLAVLDGHTLLRDYVISTGSLASSTSIPSADAYGYIPGSSYLYLADSGHVYRCTTGGSAVSSFTFPGAYVGGVGATSTFNGKEGEYVVVTVWAYGYDGDVGFVYTSSGAPVATFDVPGMTYGCVCGPGHPAGFGTTLWCNAQVSGVGRYVYQINLGNGTAVEPASLGRVKAVFR